MTLSLSQKDLIAPAEVSEAALRDIQAALSSRFSQGEISAERAAQSA